MIKSSDDNTNNNDIATALTQSLATTGVSTMTGQLIASAGLLSGPSYAFNGASKTGFYLAGTNQIGIAVNSVQAATINADTSVTFNGTVTALKGTVPVGAVMDFAGSTAPAGWLLCYGQQVSTTTYALLYAALGTTYGSGAGTFGIPDYRGRATFGQDNMGGTAANRITVSGGNFDGTVLGNTGGAQFYTLNALQLPTITAAGSGSASVSGSFPGNIPYTPGNIATFTTGAGGGSGNGPGGSNNWFNAGTTLGSTGTASVNTTSNNTGGQSHPIMNPAIITNKIIFAGV